MCPIKPVKHYFFSSANIAEWSTLQTESHTACVRVLLAAKRFRQMHAKINIFHTVLVLNIENGKLHKQVDSVDTGLNRESKSHSVVTLLHIRKFPRKNYSCWERLNFYYCHQDYNNRRRYDGWQWLTANSRQITADDCLAFILGRPLAISTLIPRLTE